MHSLRQRHLKPLDGLRGFAILMVICSHAFSSNSESGGKLVRLMGVVLSYGMFGVDLFFVLSGFLITGILVDTMGSEGYFSTFYRRRILRIFPLYYGVLFTLLALTPLLHLHWNGMGPFLLTYLQNLRPVQIVTFTVGRGIALNHLWSLAIEEQFYMVWPLIVFFVPGRRLFRTTLALAVGALLLRFALILHGVGPEAIHVNTATRADTLLIGGLFALLYRSGYWSRILRLAPWGFLAASSVILTSILMMGREFFPHPAFSLRARLWMDGPRYTLLALAAACLLAWSLRPDSMAGWIFKRSWLCFLGRYSYGIYVLHMIPLSFLVGSQRAILFQWTHSKLLSVALAGFSSLAIGISAAYLCFHLYEKPFLRLKRPIEHVPVQPKAVVETPEAILAVL